MQRYWARYWAIGLATGFALAGSAAFSPAMSIIINPGTGLATNTAALAAFDRAANSWASLFSDPITIRINADLQSMASANTIGATQNTILTGGFDQIRNAIVADKTVGSADYNLLSTLPTASTFRFYVPAGVTVSNGMSLTEANAKALGFNLADTTPDASITFNTKYNFTYDNSHGVPVGTTDFQTVATHEIGHVLGFISSVDDIDGGTTDIYINPLDMFRFYAGDAVNSVVSADTFANGPRVLVPGAAAVTSDSVVGYGMSTGAANGDGNQASHWLDDAYTNSYIGIMDPTLPDNRIESITAADIRAFDLIGYNAIPEPAAIGLALLAIPMMRRRRRA